MIRIEVASVDSLILYFAYHSSPEVSRQISATQAYLGEHLSELTDLVPGDTSLLLCYDLLKTDAARLRFKLDALLQSDISEVITDSVAISTETSVVSMQEKHRKPVDKVSDIQTSGFTVLHPGLMTQLQDGGRVGCQHMGLTTGGVLDEHAFQWANHLLQNRWDAAVVEVSFGGFKLQSQVDTLIAVTGADLSLTINGEPASVWEIIAIRAGDRVEFGYPKNGTRAYLAVKGGFQLADCYGSVATVPHEKIGGLDGQGSLLKFGDILPCSEQEHRNDSQLQNLIGKRVSNSYIPDYNEPLTLRVILSAQQNLFPAEQLERFFTKEYQISPDSDRTSVSLQGPVIRALEQDIPKEGSVLGGIQIDHDGQPILLMKDRHTQGAYPKLGSVYAPDLGQLAQRQVKTKVCFEVISLHDAQQQLTRFYRYFR